MIYIIQQIKVAINLIAPSSPKLETLNMLYSLTQAKIVTKRKHVSYTKGMNLLT